MKTNDIYEEMHRDFCESFATAEARRGHMFRLFASGLDIKGINREDPRVVGLLAAYAVETNGAA